MTPQPEALYLGHMLAAIDRVVEVAERIDFDEFQGDWVMQDAVIRELQVLGEAAGRLSREFTARHPNVPWRKVTGLRHKIVHDYFAIDLKIVWDTATIDAPAIRPIVRALLDEVAE